MHGAGLSAIRVQGTRIGVALDVCGRLSRRDRVATLAHGPRGGCLRSGPPTPPEEHEGGPCDETRQFACGTTAGVWHSHTARRATSMERPLPIGLIRVRLHGMAAENTRSASGGREQNAVAERGECPTTAYHAGRTCTAVNDRGRWSLKSTAKRRGDWRRGRLPRYRRWSIGTWKKRFFRLGTRISREPGFCLFGSHPVFVVMLKPGKACLTLRAK